MKGMREDLKEWHADLVRSFKSMLFSLTLTTYKTPDKEAVKLHQAMIDLEKEGLARRDRDKPEENFAYWTFFESADPPPAPEASESAHKPPQA